VNIRPHLESIKRFIEEAEYKGYDPYDALNSPILKVLAFNAYLRIALIQALKRIPFNLRPVLLIQKGVNPKGLGLFLWSYARLYQINRGTENIEKIEYLLELLDSLRSPGYSGNCWGYNFDWQSRAFYIPKYTPTIVNSSFIGHALLDTWKYAALEKAMQMALPIGDFILRDLHRFEEGNSICFSYTPLDNYFVHNANLLGASLLIRLYRYTGEERVREAALAAFAYSMKHQRKDGSWVYAEKKGANWIDSFHTGFNLQSILYFLEEGYCDEYKKAFKEGVKFYAENFFLEDGTPKYYHNRVYPLDIHSASQAVVFFSRLGVEYRPLTDKIVKWMITKMQDKKGYFYFQKHPLYTNKIPYMRWSQAWAFHALTEYYLNENRARS